MEIPTQTETYDSLPNASFPDAKKLQTGTVKLTSDDQKDGAINIQSGFTDKSIGDGTTIDVVNDKGEKMELDSPFNIVVKPQEVTAKRTEGGFVIENPNPGRIMTVWVDGERIDIDNDFPLTILNSKSEVYAMIGSEQAIKITKEGPLSKTMNVKKFTLDGYTDENDGQRMIKSDRRVEQKEIEERQGNIILSDIKPSTKLTISGEFVTKVKDEKKPIIITSIEPADDEAIVLKDEGKKVDDFKIMLVWNAKEKCFDVWNKGKTRIDLFDPFGVTSVDSVSPNEKTRYNFGDRLQIGNHTVILDDRNMDKDKITVPIGFARTESIGNDSVIWD